MSDKELEAGPKKTWFTPGRATTGWPGYCSFCGAANLDGHDCGPRFLCPKHMRRQESAS